MTTQTKQPKQFVRLQPATPFSNEDTYLEEALIGAILTGNIVPDAVRHLISPEHFFLERHRWIYAELLSMDADGAGTDPTVLAERLRQAGRLSDVGGTAYFSRLIADCNFSSNAEHYALLLDSLYRRRQLVDAASKIATVASSGKLAVTEVQEQAAAFLQTALNGGDANAVGPVNARKASEIAFDKAIVWATDKQSIRGYRSGITRLDHATGGFMPGHFVVIIGRTGSGKSTILRQFIHQYQYQGGVVIFPTEQSVENYTLNLYSYVLGCEYSDIVRGNIEADDIARASEIVAKWNITFYDKEAPTPAEVVAFSREMRRQGKGDVIIVDGLGDMSVPGEDIYTATTQRVAALHSLSRMGFLVVSTVQANRGIADRRRKNPVMADAQGGGIIEQKCTHFLSIYRPGYEVMTQEVQDDDGDIDETAVEIHILKDRFFNSQGTTIDGNWIPGAGFRSKDGQ